jgi:cobalt-zinc-cadmium efflux system protein
MSEVEVKIVLPEVPAERPGQAHRHGHAHGNRRRLSIVLLLTAVVMIAELLGGLWTGSLALLADAGHLLADVAVLILALMAVWFGARPATPRKTFGYYRLEILAALINGVGLVLISFFIFYEAYQRWFARPVIRSVPMTIVAAGGLIVNLICALLLHRDREEDLNVRGAWLHVIGDALGSTGAIIAGVLIMLFGWTAADSLISVFIGLLIVWSSWHLIRDATNVLLEGRRRTSISPPSKQQSWRQKEFQMFTICTSGLLLPAARL